MIVPSLPVLLIDAIPIGNRFPSICQIMVCRQSHFVVIYPNAVRQYLAEASQKLLSNFQYLTSFQDCQPLHNIAVVCLKQTFLKKALPKNASQLGFQCFHRILPRYLLSNVSSESLHYFRNGFILLWIRSFKCRCFSSFFSGKKL